MKSSFCVLIAACILLVFSLSGCASRPDEELKAATEAMNQAIEGRAELYVPDDWKGAKELWDQANDQLTKQQYAAAKETLMRARARFTKVRDRAKEERESYLKQVTNIQANIATNYDAFKANKQASANKKEFQAACADIDGRNAIIKESIDKGDLINAKSEALKTVATIEFYVKKLGGGATKAGK